MAWLLLLLQHACHPACLVKAINYDAYLLTVGRLQAGDYANFHKIVEEFGKRSAKAQVCCQPRSPGIIFRQWDYVGVLVGAHWRQQPFVQLPPWLLASRCAFMRSSLNGLSWLYCTLELLYFCPPSPGFSSRIERQAQEQKPEQQMNVCSPGALPPSVVPHVPVVGLTILPPCAAGVERPHHGHDPPAWH